ncbi:MAG: helicase [Planctomycetes bacterium]|nr:helicase [Planctomycetota bacterium]
MEPEKNIEISEDGIREFFSEGGPIASMFEQFEHRQEQIDMATLIHRCYQQSRHAVIEAGTGVGKSFAYLVPALFQSLKDRAPVVVSTHTIALQEQLLNKDLPFLKKVMPFEFTATIVKGRGNYVCLRKMNRALQAMPVLFASDESEELEKIVKWARGTSDGTLSDLDFQPNQSVWQEVSAESGNCLAKDSPHYAECHWQKSRQRIWGANLLIVNHALLFTDLAIRENAAGILPVYKHLVIDEAHTAEEVAASHLGIRISLFRVKIVLGRLYNKDKHKGLLTAIPGVDLKLCERVHRTKEAAEKFFFRVHLEMQTEQQKPDGDDGAVVLRFREPLFKDQTIVQSLQQIYSDIQKMKDRLHPEEVETRMEIQARASAINELAKDFETWCSQVEPGFVYWAEGKFTSRSSFCVLNAAPISVAEILREKLFDKLKSVVMTSATLATKKDDFEYFSNRIGVPDPECLQLGSPFDYKKNVTIYVPTSMPVPEGFSKTRRGELSEYDSLTAKHILKFVKKSGGGAFVLFTSYYQLRLMAETLKRELETEGMNVLVHGSGMPRSKMIGSFKANPRSVLFGTDSFWQGVDVRGDALRMVIIVKLPFQVPTHPLVEAKIEHIELQGKSSFTHYSLPEAIMKLRQGFGRLIRTKTDKGEVVILDRRVLVKGYGRSFLGALPQCTVNTDPQV